MEEILQPFRAWASGDPFEDAGEDPFESGPSAEGHERNVQSPGRTGTSTDFEYESEYKPQYQPKNASEYDSEFGDMDQDIPDLEPTFAEAQEDLREFFVAEGSADSDEDLLKKPSDRLRRIRDAFLYLQEQLRADPVYTSFAQRVKQVIDHPEHWKPLRSPKFRERLTILFTHCRAKRRRIQYLFSCLKDTLSELAEHLSDPEEEEGRRRAMEAAVQSWKIRDELLEPFDGYDTIVRGQPPEIFW